MRDTSMNDLTEITGLRDYPLARRGLMMTGLISGFTLATTRGAGRRRDQDPHHQRGPAGVLRSTGEGRRVSGRARDRGNLRRA
jgi:hypothetical protein